VVTRELSLLPSPVWYVAMQPGCSKTTDTSRISESPKSDGPVSWLLYWICSPLCPCFMQPETNLTVFSFRYRSIISQTEVDIQHWSGLVLFGVYLGDGSRVNVQRFNGNPTRSSGVSTPNVRRRELSPHNRGPRCNRPRRCRRVRKTSVSPALRQRPLVNPL